MKKVICNDFSSLRSMAQAGLITLAKSSCVDHDNKERSNQERLQKENPTLRIFRKRDNHDGVTLVIKKTDSAMPAIDRVATLVSRNVISQIAEQGDLVVICTRDPMFFSNYIVKEVRKYMTEDGRVVAGMAVVTRHHFNLVEDIIDTEELTEYFDHMIDVPNLAPQFYEKGLTLSEIRKINKSK